jgi:phage baseplate assembly protein V
MGFEALLAPLWTRVRNMVSRAVLSTVNDSAKMQLLQLQFTDTEFRGDLERFQNYGFTSVPQSGAEAAVVFVGGDRDHALVLAVDDRRYRLTGLQNGEVAMYTDQGDKIVIKRGGDIEITGSSKVSLNAPEVDLGGNTHPVAKVDSLNTAIVTLGNSIASAVGSITPTSGGTAAGTAITTAVGTFSTSAASALSSKVKLS